MDATALRSRRALLLGALGGVAAVAAGAVGRVAPVAAHDPDDVQLGAHNTSGLITTIERTSAGDALQVMATGASGAAIFATGAAGIEAVAFDKYGMRAVSTKSRGGTFNGKVAQIRLEPSTAASHPKGGLPGDLFVDSQNRLWFCKQFSRGVGWVRIV